MVIVFVAMIYVIFKSKHICSLKANLKLVDAFYVLLAWQIFSHYVKIIILDFFYNL